MTKPSNSKPVYRYSVSGCAAHTRLVPLLPSDWEDVSPNFKLNSNSREEEKGIPDFVWENAPRKETKAYRDTLKAYSHLPNGTVILDSKWVLARLLDEKPSEDAFHFPLLAALESHCFRGPNGYLQFCEKMFCTGERSSKREKSDNTIAASFPDILVNNGTCPAQVPPEPSSLWVVKDAFSNGAGGIWVVDKASAATLHSNNNNGPLYNDHRYVAQRYAWPPVLYGGRKCHVRVYGLITADGRAFVHKRAFLHVANNEFSYEDGNNNDGDKNPNEETKHLEDSVHITNCCANSHDDSKFAGEILADLEATEFAVDQETGQTIVPLRPFFTSMKSSLAAFTHRAMPFLSGGQMNNGMEYLGMDFILSFNQEQQPVAYLLEVNAPPSQDTATGLKHAEGLHDSVIRDILTLWVLPKVSGAVETPGGWRLAYTSPQEVNQGEELILPSKAAIINKIRWGMTERKATKKEQQPSSPTCVNAIETTSEQPSRYVPSTDRDEVSTSQQIQAFARSKFPFFQRTDSAACASITEEPHRNDDRGCNIFWENAGGSQVPMNVIDEISTSLCHRNRSVIGAKAKENARAVFGKILGATPENYSVFLGANATSLLSSLATRYVQLGLIQKEDEVILSTENHLANVSPWLVAANNVGAQIKWWAPTRSVDKCKHDNMVSSQLQELLTPKSRIVAVSHASNILGQVRDLSSIRTMVETLSGGYAHLVVDGVAAAPHWYAAVSDHKVDWYVVSCHKLFGPHLGALCGRQQTGVRQMRQGAQTEEGNMDAAYKLLEVGTLNYEGCSGIQGLGNYFADLASPTLGEKLKEIGQAMQTPFQSPHEESEQQGGHREREKPRPSLTTDIVEEAYRRIKISEAALTTPLLGWLRSHKKIRIIEVAGEDLECVARLPVVSFMHQTLNASTIVETCFSNGIACRHGSFLSNEHLLRDFGVSSQEGVVRLSLAHYNTCSEIEAVIMVLETIPGWS